MPKIPKHIERLCACCADYEILVKAREGLPAGVGPFCHQHKMFFPEPKRWIRNPFKKKPGERSCDQWRAA